MKILPLVIILILLMAWYLSFSATRLDRLHHRVETSWANLDAVLQRRAAIALEITHLPEIDPASSLILTSAAYQAREAAIAERSDSESGLSESLKLLTAQSDLPKLHPEIFEKLAEITARVKVCVAIHLESVNATKLLRQKAVFKIFRLAGRAPLPVRYAFEDDLN